MARIAIYTDFLVGGGVERSSLRIAKGLIDRGHAVDFLLLRSWIHYPDEVPPAVRLFVLDMAPDEKTRTTSAHHLERCIPLLPEIQTTARMTDYIRLIKELQWGFSSWLKGYMHPVKALRMNPLGIPNGRWLRYSQFVATYVSKENPDCVLPQSFVCTIATLWATSLLSKFPPVIPTFRSVIVSHGQGESKARREEIRLQRLLKNSAHVITVSDGVRDQSALIGTPPDKVSTIYNPVVTHELNELKREAPDHPWMEEGGPPVVLAVGRLVLQKQHSILIKAFHTLVETRDLRLIILGEGELRQQTEELVRSLNLEDRVSLPGWANNPFAFMSRAALFVLSSKWEGLPGVLIQALACGCPVVSTDCPAGPFEVLKGGRFGPLVPVGDHAALADAMGRVLDNPPDREMLMQRAAFFSDDKAVDGYEKLISETVGRYRTATDAEAVE